MKKNKPYFYGISVDGLILKVAEIESTKGNLLISRIESYKLEKSLFSDFEDLNTLDFESGTNNSDLSLTNISENLNFDDIDIFSDSSNDNAIDLFSENDKNSSSTNDSFMNDFDFNDNSSQSNSTPEIKEPINNSSSFQSDATYQFLSKFNLNNGKISFSSLEGKAQWKLIRTSKKISFKELKKLALTPEQIKDSSYHFDFIQNPDKSFYAIIHQGDFEIMTLLNNCSKIIYNSSKPFYYQYIEPFEISILNIFNLFYNSENQPYTTLLYLGEEAKLGIVIKDKKIVKNFPIMIFDTDPQKVREAVFAKLMLEQESSDYPIIENIILAGDYATKEDIIFYNEKTSFNHKLFSIESINNPKLHIKLSEFINENNIPSFIIPISLALRGALPKYKDFWNFNLLPKKVIESQKVFKIDWHGFLIFALIFIITVFGTGKILQSKFNLDQLKSKNSVTQQELNTIRNFFNIIESYQRQIDLLQATNTKTASIATEKNSWSLIIKQLSDFANSNPMCWIDNLSSQDKRFIIRGKSYRRDRITQLSSLFEDGQISRISENTIAGHTVWDFEINFIRPLGEMPTIIPLPNYLLTFDSYLSYLKEIQDIKNNSLKETSTVLYTDEINLNLEQNIVEESMNASELLTSTQSKPKSIIEHIDTHELYNLARDNYLNNNFEDAMSLLKIIIEERNDASETSLSYYLLGEIHYVLNNYDNAVIYFLEVTKLNDSKVPESLFFISKSYEALNDYSNALEFYNILIQSFPDNPLSKTAEEQIKILKGEY